MTWPRPCPGRTGARSATSGCRRTPWATPSSKPGSSPGSRRIWPSSTACWRAGTRTSSPTTLAPSPVAGRARFRGSHATIRPSSPDLDQRVGAHRLGCSKRERDEQRPRKAAPDLNLGPAGTHLERSEVAELPVTTVLSALWTVPGDEDPWCPSQAPSSSAGPRRPSHASVVPDLDARIPHRVGSAMASALSPRWHFVPGWRLWVYGRRGGTIVTFQAVDLVLDLFFGVLGLAIRIGGDLGVLGLVARRQGGPGLGTPRRRGPRRGGGIRELAATHHPLGTNRFLADAVGATILVLEGLGARVIVRLGFVWVIGCGHVDPRSCIALRSPSCRRRCRRARRRIALSFYVVLGRPLPVRVDSNLRSTDAGTLPSDRVRLVVDGR